MSKIKMGNPVSNSQWKEYKPEHTFEPGCGNKAVTGVDFYEAMAYAKWLSQKTGRKFRLPTEEERMAAESSFVGDFSNHPLPEQPDIGAVGKNADGVLDLCGSTYDWCAHESDISDPVKLGWVPAPAPAPAVTVPNASTPGTFTLDGLRAEAETLRERLAKVEGAITALDSLKE
jgi:formylglycine-generating enzyme required for sulfatase activity